MEISQDIYKILTKKTKYSRGTPYLGDQLIDIIKKSITHNQPVPLVGFWGTGPKSMSNWADEESCEFLYNLHKEITTVYEPGIEFTFIFADMHGIHNGYLKEDIDSYIKEMIKIFKKYSFKYIFLRTFWDKYDITFDKINSIFELKPKGWWEKIPQHKTIEKNAQVRNKKHPAKIAAQKYFIMRDLEKQIFNKEFSNYIFNAFSDPKLQIVLPEMATLYFYARDGWSNTPWFTTSDKK